MKNNTPQEILMFNYITDNPIPFSITAGYILADLGINNEVDNLIQKYQWYAQISECIITGNIKTVTDTEKIEFIKLHRELVNKLICASYV